MKKIKNRKQLKAEKEQLMLRRYELEQAIKCYLLELKESLRPANVSELVFSKVFDEKNSANDNSILGEGLSHLASVLTKKMVSKTEGRIGKWFRHRSSNKH